MVSPPTSLYYKNIQIKNMQYVPIKGKSPTLPVDNLFLIIVLALLALMGEQARRATTHQDDLPVIAF